MGCTFLKHIKLTISFKYLFFISRFYIALIFMHGQFVGFYIDIHLFLKLTVTTIWVVMLTKEYGLQKNLKNKQMGCKLLEIMADGLYAVFHRFEAFLKKGWRTSSDCWIAIQRPSCFFNLCSSCSSRSNKRRWDCLLSPPRGRLCCRAGLTTPPHSHRWASHPSTHPHLLLFSGDGR